MTALNVGDVVEATVTAQGMTKGERFSVKEVMELHSGAWGSFVQYTLANSGQTVFVANAHLLTRRVAEGGAR